MLRTRVRPTRPFTAYEKMCAGLVAKGTRLLNRKVPKWARKVTLTDLELSSTRSCVLGQLAVKNVLACADGDDSTAYSRALRALKLDEGDELGFDLPSFGLTHPSGRWDREVGDYTGALDGYDAYTSGATYQLLNELWACSIRMTRSGESVTKKSLIKAMTS